MQIFWGELLFSKEIILLEAARREPLKLGWLQDPHRLLWRWEVGTKQTLNQPKFTQPIPTSIISFPHAIPAVRNGKFPWREATVRSKSFKMLIFPPKPGQQQQEQQQQ